VGCFRGLRATKANRIDISGLMRDGKVDAAFRRGLQAGRQAKVAAPSGGLLGTFFGGADQAWVDNFLVWDMVEVPRSIADCWPRSSCGTTNDVGTWAEPDCTTQFGVADTPLLRLSCARLLVHKRPVSFLVDCIPSLRDLVWAAPDRSRFLVVVFVLPPDPQGAVLHVVTVFQGLVPKGSDPAGDALWKAMTDTGPDGDRVRRRRLRCACRVAEARPAVRTILEKLGAEDPVSLHPRLSPRFFAMPQYLEVDIHVGSNPAGRQIARALGVRYDEMAVDVALSAGCHRKGEAPDRLLGAFRAIRLMKTNRIDISHLV